MTNTTEAALRDALIAAYEKVKLFPEERGAPMQVGGDGFMDMLALRNLIPDVIAALSQPSPASSKLECGWCGLKYAEGQHFYDDTCNPCARQHGLEVPKDWKAAQPSGEPASVGVEAVDPWLVQQLEAWPTRVDERFTTNITYLMQEAAKAIRGLSKPTPVEAVLREALLDHYPSGLWKQPQGDWAGACRCGHTFFGRISSEAKSEWADHILAALSETLPVEREA